MYEKQEFSKACGTITGMLTIAEALNEALNPEI